MIENELQPHAVSKGEKMRQIQSALRILRLLLWGDGVAISLDVCTLFGALKEPTYQKSSHKYSAIPWHIHLREFLLQVESVSASFKCRYWETGEVEKSLYHHIKTFTCLVPNDDR